MSGMSAEARQAASERMKAQNAAKQASKLTEGPDPVVLTQDPMTGIVTRPTNRQRIGLTIPYPEPRKHYLWAADNRTHPQNLWRFKAEGWRLTDPRKAETIGLGGYTDQETGEFLVVDVNNCIRFGDVVLMECSDEQYAYNVGLKRQQYDDFEGSVADKARENIEIVQSEYQRARRG